MAAVNAMKKAAPPAPAATKAMKKTMKAKAMKAIGRSKPQAPRKKGKRQVIAKRLSELHIWIRTMAAMKARKKAAAPKAMKKAMKAKAMKAVKK